MKKIFFLAAFSSLLTPAMASEHTRCFSFEEQSPEAEIFQKDRRITACYQPVEEGELAFEKKGSFANPFTSSLYNKERKSIKFLSLSRGEVSLIEQEENQPRPLPFPSTLKKALKSPRLLGEVLSFESPRPKNLEAIKTRLRGQADKEIFEEPAAFSEHSEESYLPDEKQPTDGYWWPHRGYPLAKDQYSPLAKYDRYVEALSGVNPRTLEWEVAHHNSDVDWAGHCNGWVSSSILYKYQDVDLEDPRTGVVFTSSDMQGLRAASSYCTNNNFYGQRFGSQNKDLNDIRPERFHSLVKYHIRDLEKPLSFDYLPRVAVDNHIISGYKFTYEPTDHYGKFLVKADLRAHGYSRGDYVHERRIAKTYTKTYWYYLYKNSAGEYYAGEWVNPEDHPDFLWTPVSQDNCGNENPRLDASIVDRMFTELIQIAP